MPLQRGQQIGPYEIVELLGAGGMGEVYRAHDPSLQRDVAIKLLPEEFAEDADRLWRLQREARALAALDHPGIATVHGLEERAGTRFIVMELVEGKTLAERLGAGPLPVQEALKIALQIALAIEAAHGRGILHRDLKPDNVKINPAGRIKVLDFGLAKSLRPESTGSVDPDVVTETLRATRTGTVLGTVPYMSPEQAGGDEVDSRTDIWAFGCLLYELLSGRRAFTGSTSSDVLTAVLVSEPDWDALPKAIPSQVQDLLRRTLQKDPEQRLQHIGDARIEIEEALDTFSSQKRLSGASHSERSASKPPRHRFVPRTPAHWLGLALVAVLLALGGLYFGMRGEPAVTDRSIAVLPFEALGQGEVSSFSEGIHGDVLTGLSKISALSVTSRTSVMRFRDSRDPLPKIARELGVTWILRGEVQQVGDQVQVNARLTNALEDRQTWAETYRRSLTAQNLFDIQNELTQEIARALEATLTPREERTLAKTPTEDLEAYRLYVQGRGLLDQRTPADLRRAIDYFQRAIERDPSYALAWTGMADAILLHEFYGVTPPETAPEPQQAIDRALELDPDLGVAHSSLGVLHCFRREGPEALQALRRAVELRPSYGDAYTWLSWMHLMLGQPDRALAPGKRAVELDPMAPALRVYLAEAYLANGDAPTALEEARRAREDHPEYGLTHFMEGLILHHLNRLSEAESALQRALPLVPPDGTPTHAEIWAALAVNKLASGERAEAGELLSRIDEAADPFSAGLVHAALGERNEAFEAFERVTDWWTFSTEHFRYFFPDALGPLREDPRYERILRTVNTSWGLDPEGRIPDPGG